MDKIREKREEKKGQKDISSTFSLLKLEKLFLVIA